MTTAAATITPFYYMALSHEDWDYKIHEFDWLKSILSVMFCGEKMQTKMPEY